MKYVICIRHPQAVAASLASRDKLSPELGRDLWEHYMTTVIASTDGHERIIVDYERLMRDCMLEARRLAKSLGLPFDAGEVGRGLKDFLRPELEHHRGPFPRQDGTGASLYLRLREASHCEDPQAVNRLHCPPLSNWTDHGKQTLFEGRDALRLRCDSLLRMWKEEHATARGHIRRGKEALRRLREETATPFRKLMVTLSWMMMRSRPRLRFAAAHWKNAYAAFKRMEKTSQDLIDCGAHPPAEKEGFQESRICLFQMRTELDVIGRGETNLPSSIRELLASGARSAWKTVG